MEDEKETSYIVTLVTDDGEDIVAVLGNAKPPRYDTGWTWGQYQAVLRRWLEKNAIELGDVHDEEGNVTFIVYRAR